MNKIQMAVFLVGVCFLNFKSGAQPLPFLTNGLVSYFPFNGNANDAWGTNNGTPNNITYTSDRFGSPNAAASFAGNSTSYIVVNTTNFNLATFSISVWINPTAGLGIEGPRIFSTGGYEITCDSPGNNLAASPRFIEFLDGLESSVFQAGVWTHVVVTLSCDQARIYLNGTLSACVTNSQPPTFLNGWLPTIGVNAGNYNNDNYGGLMSDLAIYDRVLSPLEVAEIYQSSLLAGITVVPGILVAGDTNEVYSIEYISSPSSTNWTTLVSNIVLQGNTFIYPDTNAVGKPQRYYRVVAQP